MWARAIPAVLDDLSDANALARAERAGIQSLQTSTADALLTEGCGWEYNPSIMSDAMLALGRRREDMVENQLYVTFDGATVSKHGVPVDDFAATLEGIQDAMRLMVEHLGDRRPGPGQPPKWVRDQSGLRIAAKHPGSLVAELVLEPPPDGQTYLDSFGPQAMVALQNWDGNEDSNLPRPVTDKLYEISQALSDGVRLWLGSADVPRKVEVKPREHAANPPRETADALLHGWLKEVNWEKRTAQLHRGAGDYVSLRFDSTLDDEMLGLATQYVAVRGEGSFNKNGEWTSVHVEQLNETRSWREPFDLDAFRNNPNPKIFDPGTVVRASEPFDVDEFIRIIRTGRDA